MSICMILSRKQSENKCRIIIRSCQLNRFAYRESGYDKGAFSDDGRPTETLDAFNMQLYK